MKYLITIICLLYTLLVYGNLGQQKLINRRIKELKELSNVLVSRSLDLKKYNNKDVYIKAELVDKENGNYKIIVSEISTNKLDSKKENHDFVQNGYVYFKGRVLSEGDDNFKLDIEHVLPPEGEAVLHNDKENVKKGEVN
jgi:hypothetical protein